MRLSAAKWALNWNHHTIQKRRSIILDHQRANCFVFVRWHTKRTQKHFSLTIFIAVRRESTALEIILLCLFVHAKNGKRFVCACFFFFFVVVNFISLDFVVLTVYGYQMLFSNKLPIKYVFLLYFRSTNELRTLTHMNWYWRAKSHNKCELVRRNSVSHWWPLQIWSSRNMTGWYFCFLRFIHNCHYGHVSDGRIDTFARDIILFVSHWNGFLWVGGKYSSLHSGTSITSKIEKL